MIHSRAHMHTRSHLRTHMYHALAYYVLGMVHCNDLAQTVLAYLHSVDISTTPVHLPMCRPYRLHVHVGARACVRAYEYACVFACVCWDTHTYV